MEIAFSVKNSTKMDILVKKVIFRCILYSSEVWHKSVTATYILTLAMLNKLRCHAHFCQPVRVLDPDINWINICQPVRFLDPDINSHTEWRTVQIQISWPTDLDLHCLQR